MWKNAKTVSFAPLYYIHIYSYTHMYTDIITFVSDVILVILDSPCEPMWTSFCCWTLLTMWRLWGAAHLYLLTLTYQVFFIWHFYTIFRPFVVLWGQFFSAQKRWIFGNWCCDSHGLPWRIFLRGGVISALRRPWPSTGPPWGWHYCQRTE